MMRVGINGYGRIGRAIHRISEKTKAFDVVVINDINPDNKNIAYLLQYDTTYGRFDYEVESDDSSIKYNGVSVNLFHKEDIFDVPWDDHDVDIVIESSGVSKNVNAIKSDQDSNVKHFIVTNAQNDGIKTIIFGVNEGEFDPTLHRALSSSICDTISLAPIIKIIENRNKVLGGFLTTLHPWLSYQNLLDGPSASWSQPGDIFSHYSLGRSSVGTLIPKSTSAINAADVVFPGLSSKLQSFSYRVPTSIVSSAVLIVQLENKIDIQQLLSDFDDFQLSQKYHVLKNSRDPLISADYTGIDASVIIDHRWSKVENDNLLKLVYWYDNEWGYSSRVVDMVKMISEHYE
jgi:glyceraldehyde 3-phosphate dehydrogenase